MSISDYTPRQRKLYEHRYGLFLSIKNSFKSFMIPSEDDSIELIVRTYCEKRLNCFTQCVLALSEKISDNFFDFCKYRAFIAVNISEYRNILAKYRSGEHFEMIWDDNIFN